MKGTGMNRSIAQYAVVITISVALACALTERSYLPKDLLIGVAFGLLAGFYEWQKAERERMSGSRIAEMANKIRNHLQVIRGFSYIPPRDQDRIIALQVDGIKAELVAAAGGNRLDYQHRSAAAEGPASIGKKKVQRQTAKAQRTGTFS